MFVGMDGGGGGGGRPGGGKSEWVGARGVERVNGWGQMG